MMIFLQYLVHFDDCEKTNTQKTLLNLTYNQLLNTILFPFFCIATTLTKVRLRINHIKYKIEYLYTLVWKLLFSVNPFFRTLSNFCSFSKVVDFLQWHNSIVKHNCKTLSENVNNVENHHDATVKTVIYFQI